jgi:transcriptional regulator with XRE-family HTH domain
MSNDEKKFLDDIAAKLVATRKSKGMTQERLAELAGLEAVSIGYIEQGKRRPTITTLYRLAKALEVSTSSLLD